MRQTSIKSASLSSTKTMFTETAF